MKPKTVRVVAREVFVYDGVNRFAGESFDAPVEDARILTLVGRVAEAPRSSPPPAAPEPEDLEAPSTPRGRSRRKDIVPED